MSSRAQTGRADLLRALASGVNAPLTLDATESAWFGFVPQRREVELGDMSFAVAPVQVKSTNPQPTGDSGMRRAPLRMETIWAVVERNSIPEAEDAVPQGEAIRVEPITEAEARAASSTRVIDYEDLIPWARLTPVLRRRLSQPHQAGVDIAQLCRDVARQRPLRHLPRRVLTRWHPDLVVVLDFSARLWPYRWDMHRLCEQLQRQCGRTGLSLRIFANGPWGGWTEWRRDAEQPEDSLPEERDWAMPPAGARLLIVGDLGSLERQGHLAAAWRTFVAEAQAAGVHVEALLPLGAEQLPAELSALLPLIRWSPDSHLRPERAGAAPGEGAAAAGVAQASDFQDLLAMVACLRRADPPLLRALRRLLPSQHGNAGFEGAVWSHADVLAGMACEVAPSATRRWLDRYRDHLPPALQRAHQDLREEHHRHLRAALNHEEVLLHAAHAAEGVADIQQVEASEQFMHRVARWVGDTSGTAAPSAWQGFAAEVLRRADQQTAERFPQVYTALLAADLQRRGTAQADSANLPAWADASRLLKLLEHDHLTPRKYWIVEDFSEHRIQLQPEPPRQGQRVLEVPIETPRAVIQNARTREHRLLNLDGQVIPLCLTTQMRALILLADGERCVIAPVRRPHGINGWSWPIPIFDGRKNFAIFTDGFRSVRSPNVARQNFVPLLDLPALAGKFTPDARDIRFEPPKDTDPDQRNFIICYPARGRTDMPYPEYGIDRYGVYADIAMQGVTQRFRWIPPGSFWMGSPETEHGRGGNEGPRHRVTLTQGYWLADTPCTQSLWKAVMGENPSEFKDEPDSAQRPVEQVSWDKVQAFLRSLARHLPEGCQPALPTEAQWEYAARAGSDHAYWWGDEADSSKANWSEEQGGTTAVTRYAPNPWGLYDVHGNVSEWCEGSMRTYEDREEIDPPDGQDQYSPAQRGGTWGLSARFVRSAYRGQSPRSSVWYYSGFRLVLRSTSQVSGGAAVSPEGDALAGRGVRDSHHVA